MPSDRSSWRPTFQLPAPLRSCCLILKITADVALLTADLGKASRRDDQKIARQRMKGEQQSQAQYLYFDFDFDFLWQQRTSSTCLKQSNRFPMFPTLPTYSGPHQVGTIDIESPISELSPPAPRPTGFDVPTIKARIFYPCRYPEKRATPAYWVPDPQWEYLEGFAAFLGASNKLAKAIA